MKIGIIAGASHLENSEWEWYIGCLATTLKAEHDVDIMTVGQKADELRGLKSSCRYFSPKEGESLGSRFLIEWEMATFGKALSQKNLPYSQELLEYVKLQQFDRVIFGGSYVENILNGLVEFEGQNYIIAPSNPEFKKEISCYSLLTPRISGFICASEGARSVLKSLNGWPMPVDVWSGCLTSSPIKTEMPAAKTFSLLYSGATCSLKGIDLNKVHRSMNQEFGITIDLISIDEIDYFNQIDFKNCRAIIVNDESTPTKRSIFLAWERGIPMLINKESVHCLEELQKVAGGLYFSSFAMLRSLMAWLVTHNDESRILGIKGREYLESTYRQAEMTSNLAGLLKLP